jgi:hypothetical protein
MENIEFIGEDHTSETEVENGEVWQGSQYCGSIEIDYEEYPEDYFDTELELEVKHVGYCGMSGIPETFNCEQEARDYIASELKNYRKQGYGIDVLVKGKMYEILEPDNCVLVPDNCGFLSLYETK